MPSTPDPARASSRQRHATRPKAQPNARAQTPKATESTEKTAEYPSRPPPDPDALQQHDLHPGMAKRIVRSAGVRAGDRVYEIGPGLGALTHELLTMGATVLAVERDPARLMHLESRFAAVLKTGQLRLSSGDARRFRPHFDGPWAVVANPPFALTAELVRRFLLDAQRPLALDLVLQRETALKLTGYVPPPRVVNAGPRPMPGDGQPGHTRSSVLSWLVGNPAMRFVIPRDAVTPPSRVDLALWSLTVVPDAPAPEELIAVDRLLAVAFAGPHTVADALRPVATAVQIRRQAAEHGWQPGAHPRTVQPAAWLAFAKLLTLCGKL